MESLFSVNNMKFLSVIGPISFYVTLLVIFISALMALFYKGKVIKYLKRDHFDIYKSLGMTDVLDDNQIKKENDFQKFIKNNSHIVLFNDALNILVNKYKFYGRIFVCSIIVFICLTIMLRSLGYIPWVFLKH
jgi:hypothetical protein